MTWGAASRLGAGAAVAAIGAASVMIARRSPDFSLAGGAAAGSVTELLGGWALAAAGLVAWSRRPRSSAGPILVGGGAAWFLVEWNNPGVGSSIVYTLGLVLAGVCAAFVAHAALVVAGDGLRSRADRWLVAGGYAAAIVALGLVPSLFFDPVAAGCGSCSRNLVHVAGAPELHRALSRAGLAVGLGCSLLFVAVLAWRLAAARPARRRIAAPVLVPACVYLSLVALDFAHGLGRGFQGNDPLDRALRAGEALALVAVAGGVAWEWARARRTRAALARVVVELGASPRPGGLRDVLARRLDDATLELVYAHAGDGWIDLEGHRATARPGAVLTPLVADGRPVAALVHRPGLLDDRQAADEIAAAARLALEHERLNAEVRAQIAHLRASRARIVAAEDVERKRLERDLHDGAQQRLVTLTLAIRLAARRLGDDAESAAQLERAEDDLRAALSELREIANGLHPMALTAGGLSEAVEALAERSSRIAFGDLTVERFDPSVESAAYFVIAETLKRTGAGRIDVDVHHADDRLIVELRGTAPAELTDLEDRVGALDGRLAIGETSIRAELPCA